MKDIDDIRRENLLRIQDEAGGPAEAGRLLDMSQSQFTNLRDGAADSKTGRPRGMHKSTARRIERAAGKPLGWLDVDHSPKYDVAPNERHRVQEQTFIAAYKGANASVKAAVDLLLLPKGEREALLRKQPTKIVALAIEALEEGAAAALKIKSAA